MLPTLSQVCSLPSPLEQDVADYAAGQCRHLEIWLTKLEEFLKTNSVDDVRWLLEKHGVAATVAAGQGGLLDSQGDKRAAHWDHFQRRLEICRDVGVKTIVVACDIAAPLGQQTIDRAIVSLAQAGDAAAEFGLAIALEFQRQATFGNNLQTALAMAAQTERPNVGVCLDAFHFFVGPSKLADLAHVNAGNLLHVQLCDVAGVARELASDSDRILPGDGDFEIGPLVERLRQINYYGCVSVEVMNPRLWQAPPRQFGEIALTALRRALGLASMEAGQ